MSAPTISDRQTTNLHSTNNLETLPPTVVLDILGFATPTDILSFAACNAYCRRLVNTYITSIAKSLAANYEYADDRFWPEGKDEYMHKIVTNAWKFSDNSRVRSGWKLFKIIARFKTVDDLAFYYADLTQDKFAIGSVDWPPNSDEPAYELVLQLHRGCTVAFELIDIYKDVTSKVASDPKIRDHNRVKLLYSRLATEQLKYIKQCHPLEVIGFRLYQCFRASHAWLLEGADTEDDFLHPLGYQKFFMEAKAAPAWTAWVALEEDSPEHVLRYLKSAVGWDRKGYGVYEKFSGMYIGVRAAILRARKLYRDTSDATIQEQVKTAKAVLSAVEAKSKKSDLRLKDLLPSMNDDSESLHRKLKAAWEIPLTSSRGQRQFLCKGVKAGKVPLSMGKSEMLWEMNDERIDEGWF